MPIALDPADTFDFVLESDRGKPDPPAFVFHHLTRRQLRRWEAIHHELAATEDENRAEALVDEAIALGLVGWKNMRGRDGAEIPYGDAEAVLTLMEKSELARGFVPAGMRLEREKKVSPSPSPPATASSAPAAEPAAA